MRSRVTSVCVAIQLVAVAQVSYADDAGRPEPNNQLEEVVVTAQKREQRLQDVPISMSVLAGADLDSSSGQSVYDALNTVPGVVIPPTGGAGNQYSQISIRGVGADGPSQDGASPVAFYLDTVPFGFVRNAYVPDTDVFDLQRVEVLRGPQGTLYGANAEDGVVRVLTNDADPSGFDLKARGFGSYTDLGGVNGGGDLAVNVPLIDNQLAVRAVVSYKDMSGWIDRPNERNANDAHLRDYRLKVAYLPVDGLAIQLSAWRSRDNYGAFSIGLPNGTSPSSGVDPEPFYNDFDAYGARVRYQFSGFTVTSTTSYLDLYSYAEQPLAYAGPVFTDIGFLSLNNLTKSNVFSEELTLNSADAGPWHWTAGVFYRDAHDFITAAVFPAQVDLGTGRDSSRSYAMFGELGRKFLDNQLEWTLGLRQFHDHVSTLNLDPTTPASYVSESFNATTPRAVLSWYPSAHLTVYSSFSEGFRSGMPQVYSVTLAAPEIPPVSPDKLYNYEVGVKGDLFDHRLVIDSSVYYVQWRNVQQSISVPLPEGGYYPGQVNASNASGPGVDVGLTLHATEQLQLGATLSWNHLTVDSAVFSGGFLFYDKGDRLNNSSQYTGNVFASYTVSLGSNTSAELSASGNYQSKQAVHGFGGPDSDGAPFVNYGDGLFLAQAACTVSFRPNWAVRLYGTNLTNESRSLTAAPPGWPPSYVESLSRPRPRTVGLEVNYRYK